MGDLYITGDKHGDLGMLSGRNFPEGRLLKEEDVLVVLGDFGLFYDPKMTPSESWWFAWLNDRPWTTAFIDGNHENFDRLAQFPTATRFGGPVGMPGSKVLHLLRGNVYDIAGHSCFVMGGAASTDRESRTPGLSWWPEEIPSRGEMEHGFDSLDARGWKVDLVFSHVAPASLMEALMERALAAVPLEKGARREAIRKAYEVQKRDPCALYLEEVRKRLTFKKWYFGHHHMNVILEDGFVGLFHQVVSRPCVRPLERGLEDSR